jgi:hypothetical protein
MKINGKQILRDQKNKAREFQCVICLTPHNTEKIFIIPHTYGGTKGEINRVWLCSTHEGRMLTQKLLPHEQAVIDPQLIRLVNIYQKDTKKLGYLYYLLGIISELPMDEQWKKTDSKKIVHK